MAAAALLRRGVCRTASAAARTPVAARAPATRARWAQRPLATTPATLSPGEDLGSFDYGFSKDRIEKGNVSGAAENRGFTYLLMGANKFIYASAVRIGALKFIATMSATKDVLALASAEFDVSAVEEGQTITVCTQCPYVRHRRITQKHRSSGAASPCSSDIARPTRSPHLKPCRWMNCGTRRRTLVESNPPNGSSSWASALI